MNPYLYHKEIEAKLLDSKIIAKVNINLLLSFGSYQTAVRFEWKSSFYQFTILESEWSTNGVDEFISMFHQHCPRDPYKFGTCSEMCEMSTQQRLNCLYQAVSDIFHTMDLIVSKHPQYPISYATWFKKSARVGLAYRDLITSLACDAIIECNLTVPGVDYEDVRFQQDV